MVIIAKLIFPPESAEEMGNRFKELKALPDYITMKGPFIRGSSMNGVEALTLYECDNSRLSEALNIVGDRLAIYFSVDGFTYSVNVWFEALEALKMIGLG